MTCCSLLLCAEQKFPNWEKAARTFIIHHGMQGVIITLLSCTCAFSWHAYDKNPKSKSSDCELSDAINRQSPYRHEDTQKKCKLWHNLTAQRNTIQYLYGFDEAINIIFDHQNPPDCSSANFLIPSPLGFGFGSEIHVIGSLLAAAMDLNRILLQHPRAAYPWQISHSSDFACQKDNLECYYEPWSRCTMADVFGPSWSIDHISALEHVDHEQLHGIANSQSKAVVVHFHGGQRKSIPKTLERSDCNTVRFLSYHASFNFIFVNLLC